MALPEKRVNINDKIEKALSRSRSHTHLFSSIVAIAMRFLFLNLDRFENAISSWCSRNSQERCGVFNKEEGILSNSNVIISRKLVQNLLSRQWPPHRSAKTQENEEHKAFFWRTKIARCVVKRSHFRVSFLILILVYLFCVAGIL